MTNWGEVRSTAPRRGRWSQAEIARLKSLYGLRDDKSIAREFNRSLASVRRMAESVFQGEPRSGPWGQDEVEDLKLYLGATTIDVIARILRRTEREVSEQIAALGCIQLQGTWTSDDVCLLKRVYGTRADEDLSRILGRSIEEIRVRALDLCLAKDKAFLRKLSGGRECSRMPRWSQEELRVLKEHYPTTSNLDIAQILNRSVKSVVSKAHNMGLKKDSVRLREMGRENVSLRYGRLRDEAITDPVTGNPLPAAPLPSASSSVAFTRMQPAEAPLQRSVGEVEPR